MNELKGKYSPATYHVNNAQSVLVRLEVCQSLGQISFPLFWCPYSGSFSGHNVANIAAGKGGAEARIS